MCDTIRGQKDVDKKLEISSKSEMSVAHERSKWDSIVYNKIKMFTIRERERGIVRKLVWEKSQLMSKMKI